MNTNQNKDLYLSKKDSDVTIVIETTELPAHKSILSEKSEYFKIMFSGDFIKSKIDRIVLKETDLKTFERMLEYIYTGAMNHLYRAHIPVSEICEVIACSRFFMVDGLGKGLISYLQRRASDTNPGLLLSNALAYRIDELVSISSDMIQKMAPFLAEKKIFDELSLQGVEHVLKLSLNTSELKRFEALVGWMRQNPDCSFPELLKHIEVNLLTKKQLSILYIPTSVSPNILPYLLKLAEEQKHQSGRFQKIVNKNVINGLQDLRIVEGVLATPATSTSSVLSASGRKVIFDLKQNYFLNCIQLETFAVSTYKVSVSVDMQKWKNVHKNELNGSRLGQDVLLFQDRTVRFIRIKAARGKTIQVKDNFEALYLTDDFKEEAKKAIQKKMLKKLEDRMSLLSISDADNTHEQEWIDKYRESYEQKWIGEYRESMKQLYQDMES